MILGVESSCDESALALLDPHLGSVGNGSTASWICTVNTEELFQN